MQQNAGFAAIHHTFTVDQDAVLREFLDRLLMSHNALPRQIIVGLGRLGHEPEAARSDGVGRAVDVVAANSDMLDALAVIAPEILNNLTSLTTVFIDRYSDAAAGAGQRAGKKTCVLALDVKEADLLEVEEITVEPEPRIHVALVDIVGEVIEIAEAYTRRLGLCDEVESDVVRRGAVAVAVSEIEQRTTDTDDGRNGRCDIRGIRQHLRDPKRRA